MKIYNKRGHNVTLYRYNVADTIYWVPYGAPIVVPPHSEGEVKAHDGGQCKLRVIIDGHEALSPGYVYDDTDNLCFGPPASNPDRPDRKPGEPRDNQLDGFLRGNAERVYFVDGFGRYLP